MRKSLARSVGGGIAAGLEPERVSAKRKLADLSLDDIVRRPLIDPSDDSVSRLILESFDREAFMPIKNSTVGESVQRLSRSLENLHANTLGLFRGKLLVTVQVHHRRIEAPMSQLHLDSIWVCVSVRHMCSAAVL